MQLFLATLLCILIIVVIIVGEIYMGMDKYKARAIVNIRKMTAALNTWVKATVALSEKVAGEKTAEELRALSARYFSLKKYKEMPTKITLVNKMAALADAFADSAAGTVTDSILAECADAAECLRGLRSDYNDCVRKLNKRLGRKISAAIGKLFRIKMLEELCDLTEV